MITTTLFGQTKTGEDVHLFTLKNHDIEVQITNYGGIIVSILVPDKHNVKKNIVLGYKSLQEYEEGTSYFGALIGRVANRIHNGTYVLDGKTYRIPLHKDTPNALHGGPEGFNTKVWDAVPSENTLHLSYVSADGEMGFGGTVDVQVDYTLTEKGALEIAYQATTNSPTPINLTNHSYFNLTGEEVSILNHHLYLNCDRYLPVDEDLIPTGEIKEVAGTEFDFTTSKAIEKGVYDHCMVLQDSEDALKECAYVKEVESGRTLRVLTTMEGVQFYSGNFLEHKNTGFCLETQRFPDAVNQENFPSTILHPGETYRELTVFEFNS